MTVTSLLVEKCHHFDKTTQFFGQGMISFNYLILKDSSRLPHALVKCTSKRFLIPKLVKTNIVEKFDLCIMSESVTRLIKLNHYCEFKISTDFGSE